MAKKFDAKAKAKRQKIMACAGAVILVGLLAIQVPRTLKMMNASAPTPAPSAEAAPTTVVPGGADPSLLPTLGTAGGSTGAAPASPGTLIDSDPAPAPEAGQLVSFGRFASKDPFAEQIDDADTGGGGGGSSSGGGGGSGETSGGAIGGGETGGQPPSSGSGSASGSGSGSESGSGASGGGGSVPAAGTAVIAVNGVESTVNVMGEFPTDAPVFVLVSLGKGTAKVAIAGGTFASGAPTITLTAGKTVTLVNTADGVRYELKLLRTGG